MYDKQHLQLVREGSGEGNVSYATEPLNLRDVMLSPGRYCQNLVKLQDTQLVSQIYLMFRKHTHLISKVKYS